MTRKTLLSILMILQMHSSYSQAKADTSLSIYFPSASWQIDSAQIRSLKRFLETIATINSITGYTDSVGSIEANMILSQKRAESVFALTYAKSAIKIDFRGEELEQQTPIFLNRKVVVTGRKKHLTEKVEVYQPIDSFDIEEIKFLPDQAIITPESQEAIPFFLRKLSSYREAKIKIIGHVNYDTDNDLKPSHPIYKLSQDRAKLIFDILVENGFSSDKLEYAGVGNSKPLIPKPRNDEERKKNMRVQIIVLSKQK